MRPSTLGAALAEAVFMTGFERNADLVEMSAYAPLLAHIDAWQWTPNLIWFDNLRSFGTPSYYAQQMFGASRGSHVLPITINGSATNGAEGDLRERGQRHGPGNRRRQTREPGAGCADGSVSRSRLDLAASAGMMATVLTGDPDAENTLANPKVVAPRMTFDGNPHDA